jgi:predicted regulator of Ras-like GTPase activity (Roadblock/LC7/MglB family)
VECESPYLEIKEVESLTAFFTDFFNRGSDVIAKASDDEVISILVECRNEKVLIANVNENLILILGAEPRTNIGLMRIESKKAVEKIQMMG